MDHGGADMIRLGEKAFALDGQRYTLRCNMAVLETVEDAHGDLESFMALSVTKASLYLLTAMLNEDASERGLDERWTPDQLKHKISYAMLRELDLVGMLFRSVTPPSSAASAAAAADNNNSPEESGN